MKLLCLLSKRLLRLLYCYTFTLNDVQNKHFVAYSIKDVFDDVEAQKIIDFIKESRFL